ncbi:carbamoyltransferase [Streptomyces sp. 147326]|uniref:carbamoyltransferase family protein n=1 Tax=Streptomyces sp. 147326 TaxID=3074379 RepID=UPI003857504C
MIVLGVNSYFEHPSAALLQDGRLLFAAEDERFTGIKHGRRYSPYRSYFPIDAVYRALDHADLRLSDVDEIAYSYHRWSHLRSLRGCLTGRRLSSLREELNAFANLANLAESLRSGYDVPQRYRHRIRPQDARRVPFREWPHHLSHAASAFFCSGWDEALTVVCDGAGENACTSVFAGRGRRLVPVAQETVPDSLGIFYSLVTQHLGFEPFSDEFKVMGLAAYGEPRFSTEFRRIVVLLPGGRYRVDVRRLRALGRLVTAARVPGAPLEQVHKDLAASAQRRLEEALEHVIAHYAKTTGLRKLCLAGGTFLNCVANGRIARLGLFDDIFVQPAASDAGTAVGAAALSTIRRGGSTQVSVPSYFLGTEYDDDAVEAAFAMAGVKPERLPEHEMAGRLGDRLARGRIAAVFRGRMEFGPRALGNRSLLADAAVPDMRDRLNRIKGREDFRPVAPIVPENAFDEFFDGHRNPYMLFTSTVRPAARERIPAAVHADGTARVQVVSAQSSPFLDVLLREFGARTGSPVLINTSFNVRGKPIVESPQEALACFFTSGIDCIAIGGFFHEKDV